MKPTIIYIIGDNRSGSTLLDYLLSCHPAAHSVGELRRLNEYYCEKGIAERNNWACSCGKNVTNCDFWANILEEVSFDGSFITSLNFQESKWSIFTHISHVNALNRLISDPNIQAYSTTVANNRGTLYEAVATRTGAAFIIDSSKNGLEALALAKLGTLNIRFLLLERDIWEVAYSKKKRVAELPDKIKTSLSIKEQSLYWYILSSYRALKANRFYVKEIAKTLDGAVTKTIRYSDLTNNPAKEIAEISEFLAMGKFNPPRKTNSAETNLHVLGGSPSRYEKRDIRPDTRWMEFYKQKRLALALSKFLQTL